MDISLRFGNSECRCRRPSVRVQRSHPYCRSQCKQRIRVGGIPHAGSPGRQWSSPKILGYIDRTGRPLVAIIFSSSFGALCYIVNLKPSQRQEAWNWMFAVSGLASIFTWGSICVCHIRFRQAWKFHGHTLDELPFKSQAGVIGSWVGFGFNCLVLVVSDSHGGSSHGMPCVLLKYLYRL